MFKNLICALAIAAAAVSPVMAAENAAQAPSATNLTQKELLARPAMKYLLDNTPLQPTKVFDNVYCIGSVSVVAWVLETNDGLILIDSMWDDRDAQLIETGMQELGLDPSELKYIIVTHGHGDHYGGANYLRNKYGASVVMTEVDTDLMYTLNTGANSARSPKTKVDIFVKDQDKITLGDTEVTIVETPGHTPGGLSVIFPVQYKNQEYTAVLWGGTGIPADRELQQKYKASAEYFGKLAAERGAEIELTAHLFADNGYANLEKVAVLQEGEQNPFIIGKDGVQKYCENLVLSAEKKLQQHK